MYKCRFRQSQNTIPPVRLLKVCISLKTHAHTPVPSRARLPLYFVAARDRQCPVGIKYSVALNRPFSFCLQPAGRATGYSLSRAVSSSVRPAASCVRSLACTASVDVIRMRKKREKKMKKKSLMMATAASPPEQAEELLRAACVHDSGEPDFNPSSFPLSLAASLTQPVSQLDRQRDRQTDSR